VTSCVSDHSRKPSGNWASQMRTVIDCGPLSGLFRLSVRRAWKCRRLGTFCAVAMPREPQAMATIRALRMCRKENMWWILEVCERLMLFVFMGVRSRERRLGTVGELALQRTDLGDVQALEVDGHPVQDRIVRH